jgi:multidrug resistance efflux pump
MRLAQAILVALVAATSGCQAQDHQGSDGDWVAIRRDDLVLTVDVTGKLAAVTSDLLGPPAIPDKWEYKISVMAPEGSAVKAGEVVLAFDATDLHRTLEQKQNERDAAVKEIEKAVANAKMTRRDEELRGAEAEAHLRKAALKLESPTDLTGSLELAAARSDLELAKTEVAYQASKAASARKLDEVVLAGLNEKRERADARIHEVENDIARMSLGAARASTVIHVQDWNDQKKKVGDSAWRQEKVVETAVLDQMIAKAEVDEGDASKTSVGQRVTLRLDAVPDVSYSGTVTSISKTVQRQSKKNPLKVVRLQIALDKTEALRMRPGMRFQGTAETGRISKALLVPTSAIFLTSRGPVAYRRTSRGFEVAPMTLGTRNRAYAEVLGGLEEGDEVSRTDRRPAQAETR